MRRTKPSSKQCIEGIDDRDSAKRARYVRNFAPRVAQGAAPGVALASTALHSMLQDLRTCIECTVVWQYDILGSGCFGMTCRATTGGSRCIQKTIRNVALHIGL